jgi:prepilin-type N-terminal cleavage/methylation domain-containing protein
MKNSKNAFTLVELAIVIVIIGLLVGGVLAGQELIKQSEIRRFITDMKAIESAVLQYYDKYRAYPGDDGGATARWSSCGNIGMCKDGDRNKQIAASETPMTHLLAANLIKGSLCPPIAGLDSTLLNSPIKNACWGIWKPTASVALFGQSDFTWLFVITPTSAGVFTGADTMTIDMKVDDGNASLGKMLGISGGGGACTTPNDWVTTPAGGAEYNISSNSKGCRPYWRLDLP